MKKRAFLLPAAIVCILTFGILLSLGIFSGAEDLYVYASDLTPTSAVAGWDVVHYDEDLNGGVLTLRNADNTLTFEKGIFAHVDSRIVYDVSEIGAIGFSAYVGINDGSQGYKDYASGDFEILADNVSIYKSGILQINSPAEFVSVTFPEGTKTVTLITTKADNSDWADHTIWADAKFKLDPNGDTKMIGFSASVTKDILTDGETVQIDLSATSLGGGTIDPQNLTMSYVSSAPSIATVSDSGLITAVGSGNAAITCTATHKNTTMTATVTVDCIADDSQNSFLLSSPNGELQYLLTLDSGVLHYTVSKNGQKVIEPSLIGFDGFASGFSYASKTAVSEVNDTYATYSGSYAYENDHYKTQAYSFTKSGRTFTVTVRVYDDGFAYRWTVTGGSVSFTDEKTNFVLPAGSSIYASTVNSVNETTAYESGFPKCAASNMTGKNILFPTLCVLDNDLYALLSEADLYGDSFVGSCFLGTGNNTLELQAAPVANRNSFPLTLPDGFTSPWRLGLVGDLETLVESDLIDNLNERTEGDFSWVEPGVTGWMWLSEGWAGQHNEQVLRDYVDLAAEFGWKYLILDEGWQPGAPSGSGKAYDGYYPYFDSLVEYAASKGVGFIAWVKLCDLDTPTERSVLHEWAQKGIVGIKADFFESEDVSVINNLEAIYQKCADEHLIVCVHGSNKPTGERSTWPNVINRESLKGQEYGGVWSSDTTIWPYTRGIAGPMDITPCLYPTGSSSTTAAQQIALNIVFESGLPCMASDSEEYRACNIKSFFKALPAKWDDLEFLTGALNRYTVLARQSGDEWWVGGIAQGAESVSFDLDFLGDGEYYAVVYADGSDRAEIVTSLTTVTAATHINRTIPKNGGFVMRIFPKTDLVPVESITAKTDVVTVAAGEIVTLGCTVQPAAAQLCDLVYSVADPTIAKIDAGGNVKGLNAGITEVIVTDLAGNVRETVELRVYKQSGYVLNDVWTIYNKNESRPPVTYNALRTTIDIPITTGDIHGNPNNRVLMDAPDGDFTITVRVSGNLSKNYETIGLLVYNGEGSMIAMTRRSHSYLGGNIFCLATHNGGFVEKTASDVQKASNAYLKLTKVGNVFTGYYSYNGTTWTKISETITSAEIGGAADLKIGLLSISGSDSSDKTATFSDFTLDGTVIPFVLYNNTKELCKLYAPEGSFTASTLPKTVRGYISNGEFAQIPIAWDTANSSDNGDGSFTVTGRVASGTYASSTLTVTATITGGVPGDVNGDGLLSIQDVTVLLGYIARGEYIAAGDLNGDGVVSIQDVTLLLKKIAG